MVYNEKITRNFIKINERVLKIHKDLENKKVEHEVRNTTIIIDGVKYQGYRQLSILEKIY